MDGKTGAEELIGKVLRDPTLLKTLASAPKPPERRGRRGRTRTSSHGRDRTDKAAAEGATATAKPASSRRCCRSSSSPRPTAPATRSRRPSGRWRSRRWRRRTLIGSDVVESINAMIAADRQEAERADQRHHAPPGLPAAGERVARPALPGQQHRDRRDAEDPGDEHLEEGPAQDAAQVQGRGLGPEPDLQEALRGGVRPARRRAVRLPGRRLLLRPQRARRRAAGRDVEDRGGDPRAVHLGHVADAVPDGVLAGAVEPARPDQDLHRRPSTRAGDRCASPRTRATSA